MRNANCEDTEMVLLTKVGRFLMPLCLEVNNKRSFLLCLAKIAGTQQ